MSRHHVNLQLVALLEPAVNPKHHVLSRRSVLAAAGAGVAYAFSLESSGADEEALVPETQKEPHPEIQVGLQ
jgi:hypothetical protein